MTLILQLIDILGCTAAAASLPGSMELLFLTAGGVMKPEAAPARSDALILVRPVFVVPAHNEENQISECVHSLLRCSHTGVASPVFVIADNCSDNTAAVAAEAGANIVIRTNPALRGKGYALHFAFEALMAQGFDLFIVVDADTTVTPNLVTDFVRAVELGADAVQCRYKVENVSGSMRTRWMNIALMAFNVLRLRGRDRFGLSAGIMGNGFALTRSTLDKVPYDSTSVVEDLEYHLRLVRSGLRVRFIDTAAVSAEMPTAGKGVSTQRTRWEGGRLQMLRQHSVRMAGEVLRGRFRLLEPLLDLLLLPLAYHLLLLLFALVTPILAVRIYSACALTLVVVHLCAAIAVGGGGLRDVVALLTAPLYVVWKIRLVPQLIYNSGKNAVWVRTERSPRKEGAK